MERKQKKLLNRPDEVKEEQDNSEVAEVVLSNKGGPKVIHNGYMYTLHKKQPYNIRWRCVGRSFYCRGSLVTTIDCKKPRLHMDHNHRADYAAAQTARKRYIALGMPAILDIDEYTKEGKRKAQPVAFINGTADLGEEMLVNNIPSLVPATTMPSNLQETIGFNQISSEFQSKKMSYKIFTLIFIIKFVTRVLAPPVTPFSWNNGNILTFGERGPPGTDEIVSSRDINKNNMWRWSVLALEETFHTRQNELITQIVIEDIRMAVNDATVTIVAGGIREDYVTLKFVSKKGRGIHKSVKLYGYDRNYSPRTHSSPSRSPSPSHTPPPSPPVYSRTGFNLVSPSSSFNGHSRSVSPPRLSSSSSGNPSETGSPSYRGSPSNHGSPSTRDSSTPGSSTPSGSPPPNYHSQYGYPSQYGYYSPYGYH